MPSINLQTNKQTKAKSFRQKKKQQFRILVKSRNRVRKQQCKVNSAQLPHLTPSPFLHQKLYTSAFITDKNGLQKLADITKFWQPSSFFLYTQHKKKFSIKDFSSKCDQSCLLILFIEEILNGKLHFLSSNETARVVQVFWQGFYNVYWKELFGVFKCFGKFFRMFIGKNCSGNLSPQT